MSLSKLRSILQAEKADALSAMNASELSGQREKAMQYYLGDMTTDMPSSPDRSKAVSTDVSDTVEGLMPNLMEIFAGGDEVVRFEAVGAEDEEAAAQETDYVNHVFMQKNPGFMVTYTFIKDALLSKVGVVKVWWSSEDRDEDETYTALSEDSYALIVADKEVEIVEESTYPDPNYVDPLAGFDMMGLDPAQMQTPTPPPMLHDVRVTVRKTYKCARVEAVPPEEFGISRRAKSIRDAPYCFHERRDRTIADLIADGYDEDSVMDLPVAEPDDTPEALARDTVDDRNIGTSADLDEMTRPVRMTEHYVHMDYEGTGKPKLYRVDAATDSEEILYRDGKPAVEAVDMAPFAAMTPIIITHRFFGRSIADLVMDIQRIKTAILRGLLDNLYLANNQRVEIAQSHSNSNTIDDLLSNRPGGIVRTKQPGGLQVLRNESIGPFAYPLMEYMDSTREWRTGVTRQGQGIDANALQNQTAQAVAQVFSMAQAKMKLIARIFAETGIRDLFSLLHATIRKNDREDNTIKLRNKWVTVNPRDWKTRNDMTINVGLGSGSKQQQVGMIMQLLGIQKEAIMQPQLGLVEPVNIYNALKKLVGLIGEKSVEPYFTDPKAVDPATGQPKKPPAPPTDPKVQATQQQMQLDAQVADAKLQQQQKALDAQMAAKQQQAQADLQLEQQKAQIQLQMHREKLAMEAQARQEQLAAETDLKGRQINVEEQLRREQMKADQQTSLMGSVIDHHTQVAKAKAASVGKPVQLGGEVG